MMDFFLMFFYGISPCTGGEHLGSDFSVPPVWFSGASKPELPLGLHFQAGATLPKWDMCWGLEEKQGQGHVLVRSWLKWWFGSGH